MIPIVAITGYSDAGKTTLIEKLLEVLKKKNIRVGTIKHAHHEIQFDQKGKDSWRHFTAGADAVLVSSPDKLMLVRRQPKAVPDESEMLATFESCLAGMDLVLAEGFKNSSLPKIEVFRPRPFDNITTPVCLNHRTLVAMVTDETLDERDTAVPVFGLEAIESLAEFIMKTFLPG